MLVGFAAAPAACGASQVSVGVTTTAALVAVFPQEFVAMKKKLVDDVGWTVMT